MCEYSKALLFSNLTSSQKNWCKNDGDNWEIEAPDTYTSWFPQQSTRTNSPTSILLDSFWKPYTEPKTSDILAYFENSEHSVEVERLWSRTGQIYSDKRNRMHDQTLICELFLKLNSKVNLLPTKDSLNDFKMFKSDPFEALAQTQIQKVFPSNISEVIETGDDASEIECENDEELKLLIEEEDHLSECDSDSDSESFVCFYFHSFSYYNFHCFVRKLFIIQINEVLILLR